MVNSCLSTSVFCVASAILAVLLRQYCREQSMMTAIAACGIVMGGILAFVSPMISDIREIFTAAGISDGYITLIFKATAICLITRITCELCMDCGESAIAAAAEIWGRAAVTFISLPLVRSLLEQISEIL